MDFLEVPPPEDKRGLVITRMNEGRAKTGKPPLIPRQEHIVREFVDDDGQVDPADRPLFEELLKSNSV